MLFFHLPQMEHSESRSLAFSSSSSPLAGRQALVEGRRGSCAILNRLIRGCRDDVVVQRAAALSVQPGTGLDDLHRSIARRGVFIEELSAQIRALGGSPRKMPSLFGNVWGVLRRMRFAVIGENDGDAYQTCARVERKTEAAYDHALLLNLPIAAHEVIEQQQLEIEKDGIGFRRSRFGLELN
jgi:uncharacterized protein (TIGR02284 family)